MSTPHRLRPPSLHSIRHRYFPLSKPATLFYTVTLTVMSRYREPFKGSWKLALRQWGGRILLLLHNSCALCTHLSDLKTARVKVRAHLCKRHTHAHTHTHSDVTDVWFRLNDCRLSLTVCEVTEGQQVATCHLYVAPNNMVFIGQTHLYFVLNAIFGQHVSTHYWVIIRPLHKNDDDSIVSGNTLPKYCIKYKIKVRLTIKTILLGFINTPGW